MDGGQGGTTAAPISLGIGGGGSAGQHWPWAPWRASLASGNSACYLRRGLLRGGPIKQDALAGQGGWTADSVLMEAFPTAGEEIVKMTKDEWYGLGWSAWIKPSALAPNARHLRPES